MRRLIAIFVLVIAGLGATAAAPQDASAACQIVNPGYPAFYPYYGSTLVQTKVYISGCAGDTSTTIYVCVGFYEGGYWTHPESCAGYVGHPDGWIYSSGYAPCIPGRLYVTMYSINWNGMNATNMSKFGCSN